MNTEQSRKKVVRRLTGIVSSSKMAKTVIVIVSRTMVHPKYGKAYEVSKHYAADTGTFSLKEGDRVIIEASRPISKTKRWRVVEKI